MAASNEPSLADAALLEQIDQLFACGIGDYISLPQIVVVGDQSSGKSSVLEGLVCKEFPRDSGLCTRFATQIIFRRSQEQSISVSIIPDRNASPEDRTRLEQWRCDGVESLDSVTFTAIMDEVHGVLGLSKAGELGSDKPTFSDHVLRLEISGPEQEHLSVIDVPGIFKKSTAGLTTKADIELVKDMVLRYMQNPRTVMLLVVPANPATQEILEMANDVDPEGDRTLGVLTKPDLVDKGAEKDVLSMLEGHTNELQLGWHVVRNPGQRELKDPSTNKAQLESSFFRNTTPWNTLDETKTGIVMLRARLNQVLSELVQREFSKVSDEISRQRAQSEAVLAKIGPSRANPQDQLLYLTKIATSFQSVVPRFSSGRFDSDSTIERSVIPKLATLVSARMASFSDDLARHGHTYAFASSSSATSNGQSITPPNKSQEEDIEMTLHRVEKPKTTYRKHFNTEVAGILPQSEAKAVENTDIQRWLSQMYKGSRGFEMGTFDYSILASIMRQQAANWSGISLDFVSDIIALVHLTFVKGLEQVCHDKSVREHLLEALKPQLFERYKSALQQARFILSVEMDGVPLTLNHYFNDNLQKARMKRYSQHLSELVQPNNNSGPQLIRYCDLVKSHPMSNADHTVHDIHDILLSCYKVARKRFTDNVAAQAVAYHLLTGPDAPLTLLSPSFVMQLSEKQRERIAGEAPALRRRRAELNKKVHSLEEAVNILTGRTSTPEPALSTNKRPYMPSPGSTPAAKKHN